MKNERFSSFVFGVMSEKGRFLTIQRWIHQWVKRITAPLRCCFYILKYFGQWWFAPISITVFVQLISFVDFITLTKIMLKFVTFHIEANIIDVWPLLMSTLFFFCPPTLFPAIILCNETHLYFSNVQLFCQFSKNTETKKKNT